MKQRLIVISDVETTGEIEQEDWHSIYMQAWHSMAGVRPSRKQRLHARHTRRPGPEGTRVMIPV